MTTFAEDLTNEYNRDDIKLAELLQSEYDGYTVGYLMQALAYAYTNGDWTYMERRIQGHIADEVAKRQRENDDRMIAEYDGQEPQR